MKKWITALMVAGLFLSLSGARTSLSQNPFPLVKVGKGSPQFRAITGVSMGGYGAMNIGLSHPDSFGTMACLGGPLDMGYLLKYIELNLLGNYDTQPSYPG
jgi:S-formylglutathione hydrolase FrmB